MVGPLFFCFPGLLLTFGRGRRRLLVGLEGFGFLVVVLGLGFVVVVSCFFALLAFRRWLLMRGFGYWL